MKVAILAAVAWRTPPRHYGPWEQVASHVAEGMVELGLDVTLFATRDSLTKGKLDGIIETGYEENRDTDAKVAECLHISHLMEQADSFDLIHNHFDFLPLTYSRLIRTPMVTTIHGFSSPEIIPIYQKYNANSHYVSISRSDRSPLLDYIANVYNGIEPSDFTFNPTGGDYLLYFGRIHPDKGTSEAIEIARRAKRPLVISGIIQDHDYFHESVEPHLGTNEITYIGHANPTERDKLLGGAHALLHPIRFNEPFGLSVAEAMFCGTPVIAFNRGSMPELIKDGNTGFLVENIDHAVERLADIPRIDRSFCRTHAETHFSRSRMVKDYLTVYQKILGVR